MTRTVLAGAAVIAGGLQILSAFATNALLFCSVLVPIAAAAVVLDTATATRVQLSTDPANPGTRALDRGDRGDDVGDGRCAAARHVRRDARATPPLLLGGAIAVGSTALYAVTRRGHPDPVHAATSSQLAN